MSFAKRLAAQSRGTARGTRYAGGRSDFGITVDFEGMPEVIRAIKGIKKDMSKRQKLLAIFRKQMKPYLRAVQSPGAIKDSGRKAGSHTQLGDDYTGSGHLRKSMKSKPNKKNSKGHVYIHTGPEAKRKGSGFYGYFILPGAAKNIQAGERDWRDAAWRYAKRQIQNGVSKELAKYLARQAKGRGFLVEKR